MINSFTGPHRFLSNFSPAVVYYGFMDFPTVEHAYQAAKTLDRSIRETIRIAPSPATAKKFGRNIELRPDWNDIRLEVMEELLEQKFAPMTSLCGLLLATGDEDLVEGNWWGDTFWGVCKGKGHNHLGKLLMKIREARR